MRITIANLPPEFYDDAVRNLFIPFGKVAYSRVVINRMNMKSIRKAVVIMEDFTQAQNAYHTLQGHVVEGYILQLTATVLQ